MLQVIVSHIIMFMIYLTTAFYIFQLWISYIKLPGYLQINIGSFPSSFLLIKDIFRFCKGQLENEKPKEIKEELGVTLPSPDLWEYLQANPAS